MSDEEFRNLCASLANKISNITELPCTKMKEIQNELKSEEENKFQKTDENDSSNIKNSPVTVHISNNTYSLTQTSANSTRTHQQILIKSRKSSVIRDERYERFQEFKKIEKSLCSDLGIPTRYDKYEIISPRRMEQCRKDLQKLYILKKKRQQHYSQIISEIKDLLNEMEIFTWSDFEKTALSAQFAITRENLNALHAWKLRLVEQLQQEQNAIEESKLRVADLWDKLSVDVKTRQDFLSKTFTKQCRKYVLNDLQVEVSRCEKLWRQKLRQDVLNMRKEIIDLWVECRIGQKQRDQFTAFNSEIFDEDLKVAHQQEISRLKVLHEETAQMDQLALKWSELRAKLVHLENNSKNASRFNNRGGSLLKEQKERRILEKNISTIESKIVHLAAKYKSNRGNHYYYNGRPISQQIDETRNFTRKETENRMKNQKIPLKKENIHPAPLKSRENISSLRNSQPKNLHLPRISSAKCLF